MRFLLIYIFWLYPLTLVAQIAGRVFDYETKQPISYVNIYAVDGSAKTLSDSDGTFAVRLDKNLPVHLRFSLVGYYNLDTLTTLDNAQLIVYLRKSPHAIFGENISTFNRQTAEIDLDAEHFILVRYGKPHCNKQRENLLEKKFNLKIKHVECAVTEEEIKNIKEYNSVVEKYLDGKYGNEWRKEIEKL